MPIIQSKNLRAVVPIVFEIQQNSTSAVTADAMQPQVSKTPQEIIETMIQNVTAGINQNLSRNTNRVDVDVHRDYNLTTAEQVAFTAQLLNIHSLIDVFPTQNSALVTALQALLIFINNLDSESDCGSISSHGSCHSQQSCGSHHSHHSNDSCHSHHSHRSNDPFKKCHSKKNDCCNDPCRYAGSITVVVRDGVGILGLGNLFAQQGTITPTSGQTTASTVQIPSTVPLPGTTPTTLPVPVPAPTSNVVYPVPVQPQIVSNVPTSQTFVEWLNGPPPATPITPGNVPVPAGTLSNGVTPTQVYTDRMITQNLAATGQIPYSAALVEDRALIVQNTTPGANLLYNYPNAPFYSNTGTYPPQPYPPQPYPPIPNPLNPLQTLTQAIVNVQIASFQTSSLQTQASTNSLTYHSYQQTQIYTNISSAIAYWQSLYASGSISSTLYTSVMTYLQSAQAKTVNFQNLITSLNGNESAYQLQFSSALASIQADLTAALTQMNSLIVSWGGTIPPPPVPPMPFSVYITARAFKKKVQITFAFIIQNPPRTFVCKFLMSYKKCNPLNQIMAIALQNAESLSSEQQTTLVNICGAFKGTSSGYNNRHIWMAFLIWLYSYVSLGVYSFIDPCALGFRYPQEKHYYLNYMLSRQYMRKVEQLLASSCSCIPVMYQPWTKLANPALWCDIIYPKRGHKKRHCHKHNC